MMHEIASKGRNFTELVVNDILRILHILKGILEEGFNSGIFRKLDPFVLHMMIIGSIVFHKASLPIRDTHLSLVKETMTDFDNNTINLASEIEKIVIQAVKI
jgi:hypothetical protein